MPYGDTIFELGELGHAHLVISEGVTRDRVHLNLTGEFILTDEHFARMAQAVAVHRASGAA